MSALNLEYENLIKKKKILEEITPIFWDIKEALYISKVDMFTDMSMCSYIHIYDSFYNIIMNKNHERIYQKDVLFNKFFNKTHHFLKVSKEKEVFEYVNKISTLEEEIKKVENRMKYIENFQRNSYILFLLSMRN